MGPREREKRALCGICPAGCWVIVTYDEHGRLHTVRPDETSEFGIVCKLGENSAGIVYSRDRLLHPLRRRGQKGTYDFERISWDEAYDVIAGRLRRTCSWPIGLSEEEAHCSIRLSLGIENTDDEIERVIALLGETIRTSRSSVRFVPCR